MLYLFGCIIHWVEVEDKYLGDLTYTNKNINAEREVDTEMLREK